LVDFLDDWRVHPLAKNRSRATIDSYLTVGRAFCDYLRTVALPTDVTAVRREHIERYLADLNDRVSAATTAKHYAACSSSFVGSSRTASWTAPRWRR
jgi:site-specific recombinase XerD